AGRISLVARSSSRGKSRLGESLQPFRPVELAFAGRGELLTLQRAEPAGPLAVLNGDRLLSGLYVNELIVRLVARGEGDETLFELYANTVRGLGGELPLEPLLRRFEVSLLEVCGYGLPLGADADTQSPISAEQRYAFRQEQGFFVAGAEPAGLTLSGATLLALSGQAVFEPASLVEAKQFMRAVLRQYLGEKPLHARSLFQAGH
ncbi:MAG: DNA repair protein RecO, partial [Betaproteobacteria bacterium]|nr:DNA repair protein RecO [Betaproteobacteria bacterium]